MGLLKEFKEFAMRGNVLDMAIGVIIGASFTGIVNSLVNDIIMPPIGLALGGGGLVSTLDDYLRFCMMMLHGDRSKTSIGGPATGEVVRVQIVNDRVRRGLIKLLQRLDVLNKSLPHGER